MLIVHLIQKAHETSYGAVKDQRNKNRNYLFRVTYYKYRINLEVFHVLTDGMGGINFLKELTYQYLRLVHPELRRDENDSLNHHTSLNREDSFLKNYKKTADSLDAVLSFVSFLL